MDWEDGLKDFKKDVSKTFQKSPHFPRVPPGKAIFFD
jgi:hypothetical protein